jgi:hypothetical protein
MKLAVKKESGIIPFSGFHYTLHPMKMENNEQADIFNLMGYVIIEVEDSAGERLIEAAISALNHQMEIASLTESLRKME